MTYNFDKSLNRLNTNSMKWDGSYIKFGTSKILPMWIADMDFPVADEIVNSLSNTAMNRIFGYTLPPANNPKVLNAIQKWLINRNNWKIDVNTIGFSSGAIAILNLAIHSITKPGDAVLVHTPFYGNFKNVIISNDRKLITTSLIEEKDKYHLDINDFELKIKENNVKALILCNPHNPTGHVWTISELKLIAEICQKYNVFIISDDVHSDLIMPGYEYHPISKLCPDYKNIITIKSVSKTFNLAGLQIAYYITENHDIYTKIDQVRSKLLMPKVLNSFAVPGFLAAYEHGEEWLTQVIDYIYNNFLFTKKFLQKNLPLVKIANLESTYLSWIDVSYLNISESELQSRLIKAGIGVQTSSDFGIIKDTELKIRLNLATSRNTLEKGLKLLKKALS